MRFAVTALLALAVTTTPACKKAKEKAKEVLTLQKCRKARKVLAKCFPKLSKQVMQTDKERDQECLKNVKENVTHRMETLDCVLGAKGDCDVVKKCLQKAMKAEIKYRREQRKKKKAMK